MDDHGSQPRAGDPPRTDWTAHDDDTARTTRSEPRHARDGADAPGTPPPGSAPRDKRTEPPGLFEQLNQTRRAATRLVGAHKDLAQAELADILDEVKRAALYVGIALGLLVVLGLLVAIGSILFLGEWLFGSLGWGVLHGSLFLTGVTMALVLVALYFPAGPLVRGLVIGAVIGAVIAVVLGAGLLYAAWVAVGDAVLGPLAAEWRPVVAGAVVVGALFGVVGLIAGARAGGAGGAIGGLIGLFILGALVGAITGINMGPQVGAAIGVTVALLAWLALMGREVASRGIDGEALKNRFMPNETINTTKETIEWVREQAPLGPKS